MPNYWLPNELFEPINLPRVFDILPWAYLEFENKTLTTKNAQGIFRAPCQSGTFQVAEEAAKGYRKSLKRFVEADYISDLNLF